MLSVNADELENQVYRAYGILKYARQITSNDAMTLLAQLKFGLDSGLIKFDKEFNVHKMMMGVQPEVFNGLWAGTLAAPQGIKPEQNISVKNCRIFAKGRLILQHNVAGLILYSKNGGHKDE